MKNCQSVCFCTANNGRQTEPELQGHGACSPKRWQFGLSMPPQKTLLCQSPSPRRVCLSCIRTRTQIAMTYCVIVGFWLFAFHSFGQGWVNFFNSPSTLISTIPGGQPITGPPNRWYFSLLTARAGATDLREFSFSGVYATNTSVPGRFSGGSFVIVTNLSPGEQFSYCIAVWSSSAGPAFQSTWLSFAPPPLFAISPIGVGVAGGSSVGSVPLPPCNLFGGSSGIQTGFSITILEQPPSLSAVYLLPNEKFRSNGFSFNATLELDGIYNIEYSTNLIDWTPFKTVIGPVPFILDTNRSPVRFYRIGYSP